MDGETNGRLQSINVIRLFNDNRVEVKTCLHPVDNVKGKGPRTGATMNGGHE